MLAILDCDFTNLICPAPQGSSKLYSGHCSKYARGCIFNIRGGQGRGIAPRAGLRIIAHCLKQLGPGLISRNNRAASTLHFAHHCTVEKSWNNRARRQKNAFSALHFAHHCRVSLSGQWRRILCRLLNLKRKLLHFWWWQLAANNPSGQVTKSDI